MASTMAIVALGAILCQAVAQEIVYVGSAGCDWDDTDCAQDPKGDQTVHVFDVTQNGQLTHKPELAVPTSGTPSWLAARETTQPRCLFATRTDSNDILALAETANSFKQVGSVLSGGMYPVHASVTVDGGTLLVANYGGNTGASVSSFRIGDDCKLEHADTKQHKGSSVNPSRQGSAHTHSVVPVRNGLAYALDLGMDTIFTYNVGPEGKLNEVQRTATAPGAGPRHLVQHPIHKFVYVVNEMGQTVTTYRQEEDGALTLLMTADLSPAGHEGSKAAEIVILPDGSTLYVTNRGKQNTVTVFKVLDDGRLHQQQQIEVPAFPRGMSLALGGSLLLIAGQTTGEVASYHIRGPGDPDRGMLTESIRTKGGLPPHAATFALLQANPSKQAGHREDTEVVDDAVPNPGQTRHLPTKLALHGLTSWVIIALVVATLLVIAATPVTLAVQRARRRRASPSVRRIASEGTMQGGSSAQNLLHLVEAI